jgi:hypothetical protein
MQQITKARLSFGVLALSFDTVFLRMLQIFRLQGDQLYCRVTGCRTVLVRIIMIGVLGGFITLAFFLTLLKKPKQH